MTDEVFCLLADNIHDPKIIEGSYVASVSNKSRNVRDGAFKRTIWETHEYDSVLKTIQN